MTEDRYSWHGMVCTNCKEGFQSSPANYVSVREFEFCPKCGLESTFRYREMQLPLGDDVSNHI